MHVASQQNRNEHSWFSLMEGRTGRGRRVIFLCRMLTHPAVIVALTEPLGCDSTMSFFFVNAGSVGMGMLCVCSTLLFVLLL